jgi:hypothetical protein
MAPQRAHSPPPPPRPVPYSGRPMVSGAASGRVTAGHLGRRRGTERLQPQGGSAPATVGATAGLPLLDGPPSAPMAVAIGSAGTGKAPSRHVRWRHRRMRGQKRAFYK